MKEASAIKLARSAMEDVAKRALMSPQEPAIAASAQANVEAIDAGEWDDGIEVAMHLVGYFDCQLNWWRVMSKREREQVAYYRAVKAAHKFPEPNKLTGRAKSPGFTAVCEDVAQSRSWGFSTTGTGRAKALALGAAYEDDDPDFLKWASHRNGAPVKARGRKGGRHKANA